MNRYLQTAAIAILVLGTTALVQAQTPNPVEQTTIAAVDLTPEQQNAIYAAVTEGIRERDPPEIRVGDELPRWVQARTLPGSLQVELTRGFLYAVLLIRSAAGIHNEVFLVDPSTNKVVMIIRKPLTFKF